MLNTRASLVINSRYWPSSGRASKPPAVTKAVGWRGVQWHTKNIVTVADVAPRAQAALSAQMVRMALTNNAIERRSDYFSDLAHLCGVDERKDVCRLVGNLQRLTEHEKNVREVFSSLGGAQACDAAEDQEETLAAAQELAAELAKVTQVSGNLAGHIRHSVYEGMEAVTSPAVVSGDLLQDTLCRVSLSESTLYRFNLQPCDHEGGVIWWP